MRICICDDDKFILQQLSDYIWAFFRRYRLKDFKIALFEDGPSLLKDSGAKDIVFLDMEMPDMNGIYIGQALKKTNKNTIIFVVTSFNEYLDEAMRFHVFRYLSKPVDKQRLFRNLKDAVQLYNHTAAKLIIETKERVHTVPANHIVLVESLAHKIIVHTLTGDYDSIQSLQYWLQKLPSGSFFQSHRSFILNFAYVTDFTHDTVFLHNHQFTAYLTRRKYTAFKSAYLLYLESMR